jgi:hypothetical protein
LAKYSVKNKSYIKKGHMSLLILPLSIITLFCFGFVLMQSKNYKNGQTEAAKTHSSNVNQAGSLPDTGASSYDKLPTVAQPNTSQHASTGSSSTNGKQPLPSSQKKSDSGLTSTAHNIVNKVN